MTTRENSPSEQPSRIVPVKRTLQMPVDRGAHRSWEIPFPQAKLMQDHATSPSVSAKLGREFHALHFAVWQTVDVVPSFAC
jgi:hypothetical protein